MTVLHKIIETVLFFSANVHQTSFQCVLLYVYKFSLNLFYLSLSAMVVANL